MAEIFKCMRDQAALRYMQLIDKASFESLAATFFNGTERASGAELNYARRLY